MSRAEWGTGVVVDVDASYGQVGFENHHQIKLQRVAMEKFLERVDAATVPTDSPLHDPDQWAELELAPKDRIKDTSGAKVKCSHCQKPLGRGQYSLDRTLKSCPRCSSNVRSQHVFYPSPEGFGRSDERITESNPDGDQSHCKFCRGRGPLLQAISCPDVKR